MSTPAFMIDAVSLLDGTLYPARRIIRKCRHRYVHGLAFNVIDVLLLANTKAAFEMLHQRLATHINFLRADANLQATARPLVPV